MLSDKNILATYGHHKRWKQRNSLTDHAYTNIQPDTKLIKAISLDFYYELFDFYVVKRSDTKVTIKVSNTIEYIQCHFSNGLTAFLVNDFYNNQQWPP